MSGKWRDEVKPDTIGAFMLKTVEAAEYFDEMTLYTIASSDAVDRRARDLAARLYVERKECGYLSGRLNAIGECLTLGPEDYVMRCAAGHLWIRNIGKSLTTCPECVRRQFGPGRETA